MKNTLRRLRLQLPIPLRRMIQRTGTFFGKGLEMEEALQRLRSLGLDPGFCVDVGAYHGEWAQLCKSVFPSTKVLMIEAQDSKRAVLETVVAAWPNDFSLAVSLLGPADGQPVSFSEMETGSSVYAETSHFERKVVEKSSSRLDTILACGNHPKVDFLKLDVQGYELEVLKGATAALEQSTAVLLEASLIPINAGCPLLAEVVAFMSAAEFRLFDICSLSRRGDGTLWQTDLLFLREGSNIMPQAALTPETWG